MEDRPREEWTEIAVPAIVAEQTFARARQRLEDNKRFASRNTKIPSLLQGLAACSACGYGYYRTTTTTTAGNKIYYYRCLGSDDYRYQGGRVCGNKPVRADYADQVVWDHVTALLADPALIRAEIGKRLERARTWTRSPASAAARAGPRQAGKSITAMITAYSEQLLTIDELRARMPDLRARETSLKARSPPSTPRPPTATPTSSSPATSKGSSPGSAAAPPPPPSRTPARPARRRPGHPHRTRENHHPPPHPRPGTIQRR